MQKVVYTCDLEDCGDIIGPNDHISLRLAQNSGIARAPKKGEHWQCIPNLNGHFLHFCSPAHLSLYFKALLKSKK